MDNMCMVNLTRKRPGAQRWAIMCMVSHSVWLARDRSTVMDRYMCGYLHVAYGMNSVFSLSVSLACCRFPFSGNNSRVDKGKTPA